MAHKDYPNIQNLPFRSKIAAELKAAHLERRRNARIWRRAGEVVARGGVAFSTPNDPVEFD